eukprot:4617651-Amphidinium_carterae.1
MRILVVQLHASPLERMRDMDQHFLTAKPTENIPMIMGSAPLQLHQCPVPSHSTVPTITIT